MVAIPKLTFKKLCWVQGCRDTHPLSAQSIPALLTEHADMSKVLWDRMRQILLEGTRMVLPRSQSKIVRKLGSSLDKGQGLQEERCAKMPRSSAAQIVPESRA